MLLMYHPHNNTCFHLQGSQPCHLATPNPEIMIMRFRPSLHEQCLVPSQHPNDRLVVTSNGLARVLSRKYKDGVLCLGVSDNHANSHFYFAGPDVTTVCPDVPKEIRDPLTGPPSHWSPISLVPFSLVPQLIGPAIHYWSSLVPHLIGPPSHWSPIPLVPQLAPTHRPFHWSPISLVPHRIGPFSPAGPPIHKSPPHCLNSLVPHLIGPPTLPFMPCSHWSPISLVPQCNPGYTVLIGSPSHWSLLTGWAPNS